MKNSEIKALSAKELIEKIAAESDVLQRLQFSHAITPLENPMRIRASRKLIAKYKTELRAKQ